MAFRGGRPGLRDVRSRAVHLGPQKVSGEGRGRNEAKELVQTAGGLIGEVVGRDQLCEVLIADLQDPASRRPHVLVGAMGTGKTAVLVKLTQTLAGKNVVPVPIRLRDAQEDLDFEDMAQTRLKQLVNKDLRSDGQADRIWRQLRRDDRVVVVADGLEEALQDRDDRNNILRRAIRRAVKDKLPLIIASRPHDPLRAMEVVVTELEPLGEGPALGTAAADSGGPDPEESVLARQRMTRLVEVAQVADAPLYLRLIRDLNAAGRLWAALAGELFRQAGRGHGARPGTPAAEAVERLEGCSDRRLSVRGFPPGQRRSQRRRGGAVRSRLRRPRPQTTIDRLPRP